MRPGSWVFGCQMSLSVTEGRRNVSNKPFLSRASLSESSLGMRVLFLCTLQKVERRRVRVGAVLSTLLRGGV